MSNVPGKPYSIGEYLTINLTQDILGVSTTGYVIRTSCSDEQNLPIRPCALKRINKVDEEPPDLAKLSHENVVQLLHHWTEEKDLFLVMELMDGDLAKLIAGTERAGGSPFSLPVAVDIMLQIAKGMLHLHEMGVSHPHLKCVDVLYKLTENKMEVFREGDVLVKLGGFGCSRSADMNSKNWDVLCFGLTCLEILTGDEWPDVISESQMVPDMVVARSSIPEITPAILRDGIVSCLNTQPTFSEIVTMLLRAKSYIMLTCKDEMMYSSESFQTSITQTKAEDYSPELSSSSNGGLEEIFAVHQLHPQLGGVSASVRATLIFFHGFHKGPEDWRRTWMTRDNKLVWPQKWLPEDLGAENIRVLSVLFDTNSNVSNKYNRFEMGKNLVQRIVLSPRWKPGEFDEAIILVGHSFGGVLIKSLVTEARSVVQNKFVQQDVMKCEKFLKSLAKIVFYSVPHAPTGVEFENYISECRSIVALQRSSFLQSLQEDTRFIADMNKLSADFESALPDMMKVVAFLEGKSMSKKRVLVTEKSCEGQSRSWEWHKIDKDNHFEVCRPTSKNHTGYKILLDHLQQHINTPCGLTQSTAMDVCDYSNISQDRCSRVSFKGKGDMPSTECVNNQLSEKIPDDTIRNSQQKSLVEGFQKRWKPSTSSIWESWEAGKRIFGKHLYFREARSSSSGIYFATPAVSEIPRPGTIEIVAARSDPTTKTATLQDIVYPITPSDQSREQASAEIVDQEDEDQRRDVPGDMNVGFTDRSSEDGYSWQNPKPQPTQRLPLTGPHLISSEEPRQADLNLLERFCEICARIGSRDCIDHGGRLSEEISVLGKRLGNDFGETIPGFRVSKIQKPHTNAIEAAPSAPTTKSAVLPDIDSNTPSDQSREQAAAENLQGRGGFYFKDSPALFAELEPLNRPFTLVSKDVEDKAFNDELRNRAKPVIMKGARKLSLARFLDSRRRRDRINDPNIAKMGRPLSEAGVNQEAVPSRPPVSLYHHLPKNVRSIYIKQLSPSINLPVSDGLFELAINQQKPYILMGH